jgi:hypothetical protein
MFGNDLAEKLVAKLLFTNGSERELVMNQTNSQRCAAAFGDDTDTWGGSEVLLWVEDINFRGDIVASIQMAPAPPPMLGAPAPTPPAPPTSKELDDEIPF